MLSIRVTGNCLVGMSCKPEAPSLPSNGPSNMPKAPSLPLSRPSNIPVAPSLPSSGLSNMPESPSSVGLDPNPPQGQTEPNLLSGGKQTQKQALTLIVILPVSLLFLLQMNF